ncbi:hypothetical protein [Mycobacterium haemophilum]|uniref:Peptidase M22 n=1 Tax=Mycobacterium haemophilum TaxID=29311 RepID=A0A0I9UZ11_9MYCO|nr:hypothetical protein [Mycobacterium haemophilum]AKN17448.1 peptidase M22 [Mycobacterium haemophilum DSM 44634]KLO27765.1 peptidase M22 [Mycobacterium haemophilum]KLO35272.1 peptidase M22 [Mycobacterium haemophilum]KLO40284.1 peptidase M22 [Mycobacterium haemophilum]KLO47558.1 peptidase M22 [Mycobacterium haemophilum]
MAARFLTDPEQMRAMAGRFDMHARWLTEATSLDAMGQMHWASRNVVSMLCGVRDGLLRDASRYEEQERVSRELLSSLSCSV